MKHGGEPRGNGYFGLHDTHDWCHLCGFRSQPLVDVWYTGNAEHGGPINNYIRICSGCIDNMRDICFHRTAVGA